MNTIKRWWYSRVPAWEDVQYAVRNRLTARPLFSFVCPSCEGEGGWTDTINSWIGGPYYECGFCKGKGWVSYADRFYWLACCEDTPLPVIGPALDMYYEWKANKTNAKEQEANQ